MSQTGVLRIDPSNPGSWLTYDGGDPREIASYRPYTTADYATPNDQMTLATGLERTSVFVNAGVDINDNLTLVVDALYNHRDSMQQIAGYPWRSSATNLLSGDSYFNPTGRTCITSAVPGKCRV